MAEIKLFQNDSLTNHFAFTIDSHDGMLQILSRHLHIKINIKQSCMIKIKAKIRVYDTRNLNGLAKIH